MYLGQLRHVHEALERSLDAAQDARSELSALFTDERRRVPDLDADLEAFEVLPRLTLSTPEEARMVAAALG